MADVHITGLAQLQQFLGTLAPNIERKIMRGALRAGANVVRIAAQANVPFYSGALRASLNASKALTTSTRGGVVTAKVRTKVFYAKFIEYGTRPHVITARDGGALRIGGGFYKSVDHPGITRPRPFLRPALDTQAQAAVIAVGEEIKRRLTKEGIDASDVRVEGDEP